MKIEVRDSSREKRILIGMITDKLVVSRISQKWPKKGGLFKAKWANIIGSWCVDHLNKYGKSIDNSIVQVYEAWQEDTQDQDSAKLVGTFLASISEEWEKEKKKPSSELIIDLAAKHFDEIAIKKTIDETEGKLTIGDLEGARQALTKFRQINLGEEEIIDVLHDKEPIKDVFTEQDECIIEYPGDAGKHINKAFVRDSLVAILASDKKGKTMLLIDIAWKAMLQRRKVLFLEIGDMSKRQIMRRFMIKASRNPYKKCSLKIPTRIYFEAGKKMASVEHEIREYKDDLSYPKSWKACQEIIEKRIKSKDSFLKLSVHSNSSINVQGIKGIVDRLREEDGYNADVIILDYADLLAPMPGMSEERLQVSHNWKHLRALSQQIHGAVITATQSDTAAYDAKILTKKHFSQSKTKNADTTAIIGINQTNEEKENGIIRLNFIVMREHEYNERHMVYCAGNMALASPIMKSAFRPKEDDIDD